MGLRLAGVVKRFDAVAAVDGVTLDIAKGELFTLLGPSGCGKTTLLRVIGGILAGDAGRIALDGADITEEPIYRRNIGIVFQNYALFPHLSVAENVAFGLEMRGIARAEMKRRVGEALELVRLSGLERRRPAELSGGQQQRVALARAIVIRPLLLLLDEPLSNLDARLREEMRGEIGELQRRLGITTLLVTHDIHEAFAVSERIAVMRSGKLEQIGAAAEIYARPANRFVANFVGRGNEFTGRLDCAEGGAGVFRTADGTAIRIAAAPAGARWLLVRPELVRVAAAPLGLANDFPGIVERVDFLGNVVDLRVRLGNAIVTAQLPGGTVPPFRPGDGVHVGWRAEDCVAGEDTP